MSSPIPIDPYQVLGVSKDAAASDIRAAYKKLVLKCHPDKIQDETQRSQGQDEFQRVQQAYELLCDDAKRARYDMKVRLAESRKEAMLRDDGGASSSHRPGASGSYDFRGDRVYEERVPANVRVFGEDVPFSEEPRTSSRKYEGYERKQTTRDGDDKKKSRSADLKTEPSRTTKDRVRDRDALKSSRSERAKHRDKERRREISEKCGRTNPTHYVASEEDSESDYARKMREDYQRSSRGSSSRKAESRRTRDGKHTEEWEPDKLDTLHSRAWDYIQQSKGGMPTESDRRPSTSWSSSVHYDVREPVYGDTARRSSARPRDSGRPNSSGMERRGSFSVTETPLKTHSGRKIPSMPNDTSAPVGLKIPVHPPRAATMFHTRDKRDRPSTRRSETLPLPRRTDPLASRSSKLREYDSGYSSPGTPEMHQGSSPPKSSKYMVVDENEDYSRGHRTITIDPNMPHRRHQSCSPSARDRPSISVRAMPRPSRSRTTYGFGDVPMPREMPSRHEASRSIPSRTSPPLFGELPSDDSYQRFPEDKIRFSRKIREEDIIRSSRKGSFDAHPHGSHRTGMMRNEYAY